VYDSGMKSWLGSNGIFRRRFYHPLTQVVLTKG